MHVFKKEKKKKKAPIFQKRKVSPEWPEAVGFKYNKIILFQLINTSFRIHKNNTYQKKKNINIALKKKTTRNKLSKISCESSQGMTHNSYLKRNPGEEALWATPPSVHGPRVHERHSADRRFRFKSFCLPSFAFDSRKLERDAQNTTSPSVLCLAHYCWCDWDTYKEGGGQGWGGRAVGVWRRWGRGGGRWRARRNAWVAKNTKNNEHHFEEISFSSPQHLDWLAPSSSSCCCCSSFSFSVAMKHQKQ